MHVCLITRERVIWTIAPGCPGDSFRCKNFPKSWAGAFLFLAPLAWGARSTGQPLPIALGSISYMLALLDEGVIHGGADGQVACIL